MRSTVVASFVLALLAAADARAQQSVFPGESWMQYTTPAEAGFDPELLGQARAFWEALDSAAFMVVYRGNVVVAWGDVERRYMCHSVRKSFLSALIGVHVDEGGIDVEKNLAELGIDDIEGGLTDEEKRATIFDLLCARSGVYRSAAYESPRARKPARNSFRPGENWCYNNWDHFTALLGDVDWVRATIKSLERSRNVIMHSGELSLEDIERVGGIIRDWIRQVGA